MVRERWVFVAGIACCAPYLLNAQAHQQVDIIAALMVAGCLELTRGRDFVGALLLGLSAAIKGPPLMFIGYLVFRRRWAAAALTFGIAIGGNLLPDLVLSPPQGQLRLAAWIERSFIPTLSGQIGTWLEFSVGNQGLAGTVKRPNGTWPHAAAHGYNFVVGVGHVPDSWIKAIVYGSLDRVGGGVRRCGAERADPIRFARRFRATGSNCARNGGYGDARAACLADDGSSPHGSGHSTGTVSCAPRLYARRMAFARVASRRASHRRHLQQRPCRLAALRSRDVERRRCLGVGGAVGRLRLSAGAGPGEAPSPSFRQSIFDRLAGAGQRTKVMSSATSRRSKALFVNEAASPPKRTPPI